MIHEALEARGIKCKLDDVITRHYSLLKKAQDGPRAESKTPELQQSQAEPAPTSEPIQQAHPGNLARGSEVDPRSGRDGIGLLRRSPRSYHRAVFH